jgi:hypothetical protein
MQGLFPVEASKMFIIILYKGRFPAANETFALWRGIHVTGIRTGISFMTRYHVRILGELLKLSLFTQGSKSHSEQKGSYYNGLLLCEDRNTSCQFCTYAKCTKLLDVYIRVFSPTNPTPTVMRFPVTYFLPLLFLLMLIYL